MFTSAGAVNKGKERFTSILAFGAPASKVII